MSLVQTHRTPPEDGSPDAAKTRERALAYRPDIDGLRAIAVIAVVAFHAAPKLLPGGFAGVDIFFVISGFLITGILLRNAGTPDYLVRFFTRRVRRIFPALVLVLAATFSIGWYLLLPDEFRRLSRNVAAAALFVVNFAFQREAGYFDALAEWKPLLHLWSIAVEEQFYLFWPLLLGWTVAKGRSVAWVALALIVASFALNLAIVTRQGPAAFFLLPARLWELMAGGLLWRLLARPRHPGVMNDARARDALALVGAVLLIAAFAILTPHRHFPGAWALLPVLGTCCIIAAGQDAWLNRALLAPRGLVFVGLVSYPLYLWHWPALAFLRIVEGGDIGVIASALALAVSFALATATYFAIERPIRRSGRRALPWALLAAMAVVGMFGWAGAQGWIEPRANDGAFERFNAATLDWDFPGPAFRSWTTPNNVSVVSVGTGSRRILVVGDSNAQQYGPRMEALVQAHPEANAEVVFATKGGCPPMPGVRRDMSPECAGFATKVLAFAATAGFTDVVLVAQWSGYLDPRTLVVVRPDGTVVSGDAAFEPVLAQFGATIRELKAAGKRVWFVANIPVGREFDPRYILHRQWSGELAVRADGMPRRTWEASVANTVSRLAYAAQAAGATVIDPADELCARETCRAVAADGAPIYRDAFHLRASFMREHVGYLDAIVLGQ